MKISLHQRESYRYFLFVFASHLVLFFAAFLARCELKYLAYDRISFHKSEFLIGCLQRSSVTRKKMN